MITAHQAFEKIVREISNEDDNGVPDEAEKALVRRVFDAGVAWGQKSIPLPTVQITGWCHSGPCPENCSCDLARQRKPSTQVPEKP